MATILIADDEESILTMMRTMLESAGHTVLTARNGLEALLCFERESERIDLVMTDILMPEMSGTELAYRLLRVPHRKRPIKVILMTGFAEGLVEANDFLRLRLLQKPFALRALRAAIDAELNDV